MPSSPGGSDDKESSSNAETLIWSLGEEDPLESESEVAQLCLTFCDSMDCSPPGSSIHGIF